MACYRLGKLPPEEGEEIVRAAQFYYRSDTPGVCGMLTPLVITGGYNGQVTPMEFYIAERIVKSRTGGAGRIEHLTGIRGFAASLLGI